MFKCQLPSEKKKKKKRREKETPRLIETGIDTEGSSEQTPTSWQEREIQNRGRKHIEGQKQTPTGGGGGNSHRTRGKERIRGAGKVCSNRGRRPKKKGTETDAKRGERQNRRRGERPEKGRDAEGCGHRAALARFLESLRMILTKRGRLINLNQGDTVR